ncbi:MAG: prepilin peptidase [Patescibacteria group bacterium]|jgi:prepilin signal peptidase PulO-like enzyme (type II secretory pathway)
MFEAFVFIFGLMVGSFLNVVIYRTYRGIGFVKGRSYCPHCKHHLEIFDLIPLFSFMSLRGKCRYCEKKISWQYPIVEFVTAGSFLALFMYFGPSAEFLVYAVYVAFCIIIFVHDFKYSLILDQISLPGIVVGLIGSTVFLRMSLVDVGLGVLIGAGFFMIQYAISRGKWIGGGDIRLGAMMGAMLGWKYLLVALFISYIVGSIFGIALILAGRKKWGSHVPLGTFLTVAMYATFFAGPALVEYYWNGFF